MPQITGSVGRGARNNRADVITVQNLLNNYVAALDLRILPTDGACGPGTIAAIERFQSIVMHAAAPDGRIDPGGKTFARLNGSILNAPPDIIADAHSLSGAAWWRANQGLYTNSVAIADLDPAFRACVEPFIAALKAGGARVTIGSTRRNRIRAYLMHFSWRLGRGEVRARDVPAEPGCIIKWDHGDETASQAAARAMADLFQIRFQPSLTSNHIQGKAIDMTIEWTGALAIRTRFGLKRQLGDPRTGADNRDLHAIGATYGVYKLLSDPPHWSADGH